MGEIVQLRAADGHGLTAYQAGGSGPGLVVVQEIFGVNAHIRDVVDRFAALGFRAIAPALFDRVGPGIEMGYTSEDVAAGREARAKVKDTDALADILAARGWLETSPGPAGVVGYCWGGALAWASATQSKSFDAAVGYYGGGISKTAEAEPHCPVMLHFGEQDHAIPLEDVAQVQAAHPDMPVHLYKAGHGFSCDARGSYDKAAHELALERTLAFFGAHLST
ncbi:MAG: dienelactone hydrolase family protein [Paracoccaceae bacterium]